MASSVNLTDAGFEPSLPRQNARASTTQPSGRFVLWYRICKTFEIFALERRKMLFILLFQLICCCKYV